MRDILYITVNKAETPFPNSTEAGVFEKIIAFFENDILNSQNAIEYNIFNIPNRYIMIITADDSIIDKLYSFVKDCDARAFDREPLEDKFLDIISPTLIGGRGIEFSHGCSLNKDDSIHGCSYKFKGDSISFSK